MASIAFDSTGTRDTAKPPISLHPAFPAIVALWFAALLGLGSMVLPVVLIERVVELTGISAFVPAASPPLGFTARGLIALAGAAAGAAIGLAIARRISRAHDADRPSRVAKFAKGARRPIDVNEELGGEGLVNGFGLAINRRRALAIAEDDRPSDFLYMAPLPGHDADDHPLALSDLAPEPDAPLELSDAFEDSGIDETEAADRAPATPDEDAFVSFKQEFQPLSPDARAGPDAEPLPASTEPAAKPLPFSAPSLARRAPERSVAPEPIATPAIPQAYEPVEPEPATEPQPFRGDWTKAPVDELGLVQLVQRLGASLERRRERLAAEAETVPAPVLAPTAGFDPAPAEEAAQAMAAFFGTPAGGDEPEADDDLRAAPCPPADFGAPRNPLGSWAAADDDDDVDALPSFTLPLRKAVSPTIAFDVHETPENDDDVDGDGDETFSSLLAMRNPFALKESGFVRIEEPEADTDAVEPAVVFPGHAAPAVSIAGSSPPRAFDPPAGVATGPSARAPTVPADADAALRAALSTLQRMSGSA